MQERLAEARHQFAKIRDQKDLSHQYDDEARLQYDYMQAYFEFTAT
jgi:hypothetical protein